MASLFGAESQTIDAPLTASELRLLRQALDFSDGDDVAVLRIIDVLEVLQCEVQVTHHEAANRQRVR